MKTDSLPFPDSLQRELNLAWTQKRCLILMFSLPGCPFCKVVRESHLWPLRLEKDWPVFQIDLQSQRAAWGFDGKRSTHAQVASVHAVSVTPSVLFVGKAVNTALAPTDATPRALEIAERLTGAYIPDFYGAYLDQRLNTAQLQFRQAVL
jgi:hypothetical protein